MKNGSESGVFHAYQVAHLDEHTADLRAVLMFDALADVTKTESLHDLLLIGRTADRTARLRDFQCFLLRHDGEVSPKAEHEWFNPRILVSEEWNVE